MIPTCVRPPILALIALSAAIAVRAQSQAQAQKQPQTRSSLQPVYEGPLELPCAKVLAMASSDYIAQVVAIDDSNVDGQLRGIGRYGACYDARTDSIAAFLARSRKGPTKAARAEFVGFEAALKNFTTKALAAGPRLPASPKEAYANLYEKQFRREFYQEYEMKPAKTATPATAAIKSGAPPASTPPAGPRPAAPATADERARSDADPVTQAKNRFGKILEALPEDQMHELHSAFAEVIGPHAMSETTRLAVYRYAIFLLEPPSGKPFAPPPF